MKGFFKRIHFLGIGGISQSALAIILKENGHFVSGSDRVASSVTQKLTQKGIDVCINGISSFIKDADLVIVSAAIAENDRELLFAKSLNKKIITRSETLGLVAKNYKNVISVAGSHGKTTTTAMVSKIFCDAGLNPTVHIGGEVDFIDGNVKVGAKDFFITEACEYVDSFLSLKSDVGVILNIQKDHLDYFKNLSNIKKSFAKFAHNTKKDGLIVYCADDENVNFKINNKSISYSAMGKGLLTAKNIKEYQSGRYSFDCCFLEKKLCKIKLGVFGKHNVLNALAAVAVALNYGVDLKIIKASLLNFKGVKRRFEEYPSVNGARVFHDYAHHPTEIKAIIELAKNMTENDVFVIFQPHTYSRTKLLIDEFVTCFRGAREILIYKTYPAREKPELGFDQTELSSRLLKAGEKSKSFIDYYSMKRYIQSQLKVGDILLILGAGDIENFAKYIQL